MQHKEKTKISSVIAASMGNLIEWFDFYIYAFSAVYFAHSFSASNNPTIQQASAFAVFMIGFFMRPIGSLFFGSIADKFGRKKSLVLSVLLMALGSFMIAALPSRDIVGDFAVVFLLVARCIQGFSAGGEYGVVATYLSEISKTRRGFYSSFQYTTLIGGQLLAVASLSILIALIGEDSMRDWGWRVLFIVGGALGVISLFFRTGLAESSSTTHQNKGKLSELVKHYKAVLITFGVTAGGSLIFYTITTYAKLYLISKGIPDISANHYMLILLVFLMIAQPICGMLGDKIGFRRSILVFATGSIFLITPIFLAIGHTSPLVLVLLLFLAGLILSIYTSVGAIFKASLFPEHIRALGVGVSYAVANAIFGGSAPYIALQFKAHGIENGFFVYLIFMAIIVFISAMFIPKHIDIHKH